MSNIIRNEPTSGERALMELNPTALFGFFVKTDKPAAAQLEPHYALYVAEPGFKLFDGHGMHLIATPAHMKSVIAQLKREENPVKQWLLMADSLGQIPTYDRNKTDSNKLPMRKLRGLEPVN